MRKSLKARLVETAYDMIVESGVENIRTRDLAKRVHCTAPAIYKHFESMDELLVVASLRFLQPYIEDLEENLRTTPDLVEAVINSWRLFNKYAFANPYLFCQLFWKMDEDSLANCLLEYFELFPLERVDSDRSALFYSSLLSGSIDERDYIWFRRLAAMGRMDLEDAKYVSRVNCLIAYSLLQMHLYDYRSPEVYQQAVAECNELIEKTIRSHVHPTTE